MADGAMGGQGTASRFRVVLEIVMREKPEVAFRQPQRQAGNARGAGFERHEAQTSRTDRAGID
ncbi:MAG: hypothetical protein QF659_08430 [Dehalococcoidia bacterium]|nr:hypothetical protein [Dehalococcoidia bacterium]